jgi:hypothetical protein
MDDEKCYQPGCKLVERLSEADPKLAVEILHDVLPKGTDHEGEEVSFEAYLVSRFPEEPETRAKSAQSTDNGKNLKLLREYVNWYNAKMPIEVQRNVNGESRYEHIAGPDCVHEGGYSGHAIPADEMKYCTTIQCIVPYINQNREPFNDPGPELDDEEFERRGVYYLSGLGDRCGSWEDDCSIFPARHGCYEVNPFQFDGFDIGEPSFHPHCLEIYRRVSGLRRNTTDITDLAHWISRQSDEIRHHPAVLRGTEQWWDHRTGDEFLVASPLHVSGLSKLLEAAKRPQANFDGRGSPFGVRPVPPTASGDLFDRLPEELRAMIVAPLGSKDIASLRLASHSFYYLPYTLWHDLTKEEMPWIWEAWSDRPYPLMACTTQKELVEHSRSITDRKREAAGLDDEQKAVQMEVIARDDAEFRNPHSAQRLDRLHTDWYFLYCQLRREWKNIKGLQNRERIWKAVEFVSRRIASPDEKLGYARKQHAKVFPHRDLNPEVRRLGAL